MPRCTAAYSSRAAEWQPRRARVVVVMSSQGSLWLGWTAVWTAVWTTGWATGWATGWTAGVLYLGDCEIDWRSTDQGGQGFFSAVDPVDFPSHLTVRPSRRDADTPHQKRTWTFFPSLSRSGQTLELAISVPVSVHNQFRAQTTSRYGIQALSSFSGSSLPNRRSPRGVLPPQSTPPRGT